MRLSPACVLRESRDDKVCTLPGVPPQFLHTPTTPVWRGVCSHNSLGPFSFLSLARHSKIKGSSDESGGGPQGVCRVEVWSVLFLPCYPILTWTPSCDAEHYEADNSHLQSPNDGCDQNVAQLYRTRYHVHHVIVLPVTLRPNEARMTTEKHTHGREKIKLEFKVKKRWGDHNQ